jgi:hypothetical protein
MFLSRPIMDRAKMPTENRVKTNYIKSAWFVLVFGKMIC